MSSGAGVYQRPKKKIVLRPKYVKPQTKRDKLPIANYEHDFIKRLEREKIIVVEAATGSGKSTQLPQYVAKSDLFQGERRRTTTDIRYGGTKSPLGLPSQGKIVVSTQPNAFAATAVAARVGFEYDNDVLGRKVGLITQTENRFDPTQCEILFVSDSELVRIMTKDKLLSRVGVLIIDEAHERTLYTDVIMSLAKQIKSVREDFYVVISSATIDVSKFLRFMLDFSEDRDGPRPRPLKVEGKTYDIAVHYDPVEVRDADTDLDPYYAQFMVPKIMKVVAKHLTQDVKGHILVFVHDSHAVFRLAFFLDRFLTYQQNRTDAGAAGAFTHENTKIIRLYISMSLKEQQEIMDLVKSFHETNQQTRYIFVADNVAETSITLPDVRLVIDTGRMMVSTYDMIRRIMITQETFVSRDRSNQRKGRVGRTGAGICVRLYNESDVKKDRIDPDICRVALDKVVLQLSAMEINPVSLRLIEPPDQGKFHFAVQQLLNYKCLSTDATGDKFNHLRITEKGLKFVQLPFQPDTCEQLWQASLISNEAVSAMHAICCLNAEATGGIYEHSPGLTWKALSEIILNDRPFDTDPETPFVEHMEFPDTIRTSDDYNKYPHLVYYPFENRSVSLTYNLNAGSDLELGYLMYKLWLNYKVSGCQTCVERAKNKKLRRQRLLDAGITMTDDSSLDALSGIAGFESNSSGPDGPMADHMSLEASHKIDLCPECVTVFKNKFRMLPESLQQAEVLIRSTKDLVHRLLVATNKKRPAGGLSEIISFSMYNALSHMAGVVLVADRLSEGVVLPHPYFGMVKATLDPNTCAHAISTYYTVVRNHASPKTRFKCVRYFIAVHVTARRTHDYNITTIHPLELDYLGDQRASFESNIAVLALRCIKVYTAVGKGLYSSIDHILNNRRIDNMARQYELQTKIAQKQAALDSFSLLTGGHNSDQSDAQDALASMNWSRFVAIPFIKSEIRVYNLERYTNDTQAQMLGIFHEAVAHMQHLYDRERRSYRLPLSKNMYADISLTSQFKIRELVFHIDGKSFSVTSHGTGAPTVSGAGANTLGYSHPGLTRNPSTGRQQQASTGYRLGSRLNQGQEATMTDENDVILPSHDNIAYVQQDVDLSQYWEQNAPVDLNAYQAALEDDDDDDDDGLIEILDDGLDDMNPLPVEVLIRQGSLQPLPSGGEVSITYSQSTDRHRNEKLLSQQYDPLQMTRFQSDKWIEHNPHFNYANTLTFRKKSVYSGSQLYNALRHASHLERSFSPLMNVYSNIHSAFESVISSFKHLDTIQYFPIVPKYLDYDEIVDDILDHTTASLKFSQNVVENHPELHRRLVKHSAYDDATRTYFLTGLLNIQHAYNSIAEAYETGTGLTLSDSDKQRLQQQSTTGPNKGADATSFLNTKSETPPLDFTLTVFEQLHFSLGPDELSVWIVITPSIDELLDLSTEGLRRFIAPTDRKPLVGPISQKGGYEFLGKGRLIDIADLRTMQVSEMEIREKCSQILKLSGFDVLYTESLTVEYANILNIKHALSEVETSLKEKDAHYQLEILESFDIHTPSNHRNIRHQVTVTGNRTSVTDTLNTLERLSSPSYIPTGPLTNCFNALLFQLLGTDEFDRICDKFHVAAKYEQHVSDGSLQVYGNASNVNNFNEYLVQLVTEFERRRESFPLPHNIFADLKNDIENSTFYNAYHTCLDELKRLVPDAKYELKTEDTSFVLETPTPEQFDLVKPIVQGFLHLCSVEEVDAKSSGFDDTAKTATPTAPSKCCVCMTEVKRSTSRLSTCDHMICSDCLSKHVEDCIFQLQLQISENEARLEREREAQEENERNADDHESDDDEDYVYGHSGGLRAPRSRHRAKQNKMSTSSILQHDHRSIIVNYDIKCPRSNKEGSGIGCSYLILPSDVAKICNPNQFHSILFALSRGAMKEGNMFMPCPENACNTLIPARPLYQNCSRCNIGYCTQCNISNSPLHRLLPCAIFKAILGYHDVVMEKFKEDCTLIIEEIVNQKIELNAKSSDSVLNMYTSQEIASRMNMVRLIQEQAQRWIDEDWIKHAYNHETLLAANPQILINPGLFNYAPSFVRFVRGLFNRLRGIPSYQRLFKQGRKLNIPIDYDTSTIYNVISQLFRLSELQFSYHGTPKIENIPSILHNGFDPKYRNGQAYGRGEYFGISPNVSFDYGRDFFVIALMISIGETYKVVPNFCYVVDNPADFQSSFVLPVGVVRVSRTAMKVPIHNYPRPNPKDFITSLSTSILLYHYGVDANAFIYHHYMKTNRLKTEAIGCDEPHKISLDLSKLKPDTLPLIDPTHAPPT